MKNPSLFLKLLNDDSAAVLIEYALLVALVSVVCIGALTNLGNQLNKTFLSIASALDSANQTTP
jgi:pilus assembly protein Flp/PilA